LKKVWTAAVPNLWAALRAAWAASAIGAISLMVMFALSSFGMGLYFAATDHTSVLDAPPILLSGVYILPLSLLFSFAITIPVSLVVAACAFPFLRRLPCLRSLCRLRPR
jgi:hypothetical protein